jgi:hypothetical protein
VKLSLENKFVGKKIEKGEVIATIGELIRKWGLDSAFTFSGNA